MAEDKKIVQRRNILAEIDNTELGYLQDLEILVNVYKIPLQKTGLLGQDTINRIFLNVESLLAIHTKIKLEMQTKPFVSVIATFAPQLKVYSVFTEGCDDGIALWTEKSTAEKRLKSWEADISTTEGPCKGLFMKDFLIKPVQRICKYPLLLRELVSCVEGEELEAAQEAQAKVNNLLQEINSMKDAHVSFQQLSALTNRLVDYNGSLVRRERTFIRETKLGMKEGKLSHHMSWNPQSVDPVVLLLFSDILLITQPTRKDNKLKLIKELQMKDIFVVDARDHPNVDVAFFIENEAAREQGQTCLFFTEKPAEKKVLYALLRKTANKAKEQAFKKPVQDQDQVETSTQAPQMVSVLCNAAINGDLDKLHTMLEHGGIKTFINLPNPKGQNALYCATQKGHKACVQALLSNEHIDPNVICGGETALHAAVSGGFLDIVIALVLKGANLEVKNKAGLTPKQLAVNAKFDPIVEVFQTVTEKGMNGLRAKYLGAVTIQAMGGEKDKDAQSRKSYGRKNSFKKTTDKIRGPDIPTSPTESSDDALGRMKGSKITLSHSSSEVPNRNSLGDANKLIELRAENTKLIEDTSRLSQENAILREREELTKIETERLTRHTTEQGNRLKKLTEDYEKVLKTSEEKNEAIQGLTENLNRLDQENEKLASLIQKLTVGFQALQAQNSKLIQENNAQQEKINQLDEENSQLAGLVQKYIAFKEENDALTQVNVTQKKKISDLANTIASLTE